VRELIDCHIHTERCGHAVGSLSEYVAAGVAAGLTGMVITEHLALPDALDPDRTLSMPACQLDDYLVEIDLMRQRYPEIALITGLEADYLPARVDATRLELSEARARVDGPRMVLGSVHFIGEWVFDDPGRVSEWEQHSVEAAWTDYFTLWCDAARCGLFDVMAHPDLVKKFGHRPSFDPRDLYAEAARAAADGGVLIEVSTAGLRKPVGELYPGADLLAAFRVAGVGATVGSDAHTPDEVGYRIDAAYDALSLAGYEYASFPLGDGTYRRIEL
jgi:histidinol-phosphatase (PHP family)